MTDPCNKCADPGTCVELGYCAIEGFTLKEVKIMTHVDDFYSRANSGDSLEARIEAGEFSGKPVHQVRRKSVVQPWVDELSLMQQSVLFAAIRGPDGIVKDHVSKKLARWLRRCVLIAAFDRHAYDVPYDPVNITPPWKSGSFTGPSCYQYADKFSVKILEDGYSTIYATWQDAMKEVVRLYLKSCDELPHHYQLHFMHAAEIIGYEHFNVEAPRTPNPLRDRGNTQIAEWWRWCYEAIANDMHLNIETREQMRRRLGDNENQWREAERGVHADV